MAQTLINKQQASHLVLTAVGSGQILKESLDTYHAQLIWDIKVDRKNGKILSKKESVITNTNSFAAITIWPFVKYHKWHSVFIHQKYAQPTPRPT